MMCTSCLADWSTQKPKKREVHKIARVYYICANCGKANRPKLEEVTKPKGWARKAMLESKSIRMKFLQAIATYRMKILIWGPGKNSFDKKIYMKNESRFGIFCERNDRTPFSVKTFR